MTDIILQLIGVLAMCIDVRASLCKDDKKLKKLHSLGSFVFSIHYFFLGSVPGALSEILNSSRTMLSIYTPSRAIAFIFLGIYIFLLAVLPDQFIDTLPFMAGILITVGIYFFTGIKMRIFYLLGCALWLIYSITVFSIGGILMFSMMLVTTTRTIVQLKKTNNKKIYEKDLPPLVFKA